MRKLIIFLATAVLAISVAPAVAQATTKTNVVAHAAALSYNEAGFVGGQFAKQWIAPNFFCTHAPDTCGTGYYAVYRNPASCGTNCVDADIQVYGWFWTFALRVRVQGPYPQAGVTATSNWWDGRWH